VSEQTVAAALASRLATLSLPTEYENSPFTPVAGQTYLKESFLVGDRIAVGLAQTDAIVGVYQVLVMAPRDGTKGPGMMTAKLVEAAFQRGLRLVREGITVAIMQTSQGAAMMAGDRWAVPVRVEFRAYV
jgi:hypothetical protein